MAPTVAKILSRFDGDAEAAIQYCSSMVRTYPHLREEYNEYKQTLIGMADDIWRRRHGGGQ